jgi:hypothetical protein
MRKFLPIKSTAKFLSLAILLAASAPFAAWGQSEPAPAPTNIPVPAVADIMGQTQLRHFKLWFAGALGNWPLANFEVEQMKRSFTDSGRLGTSVAGTPLSKLVEEKSLPPLADVETAIAAKSEKEFVKAYKQLTEACNACHVAANVGFIKIQTPTASPFSNQAFPP